MPYYTRSEIFDKSGAIVGHIETEVPGHRVKFNDEAEVLHVRAKLGGIVAFGATDTIGDLLNDRRVTLAAIADALGAGRARP